MEALPDRAEARAGCSASNRFKEATVLVLSGSPWSAICGDAFDKVTPKASPRGYSAAGRSPSLKMRSISDSGISSLACFPAPVFTEAILPL